jgi:hypothetical protein
MQDYTINVNKIEEYQTIKNLEALRIIFERAKSAVVNGARVILVRRQPDGRSDKFDEISTETDLEQYRKSVFKYL